MKPDMQIPSPSIFQKNIQLLSKKSLTLSSQLEQVARIGTAVWNKNGEISLQINGNFILNKLYPKAEAQKRVESVLQQNNSIICVLGLTPIYHVECLREKFSGKIVVYEPHAPLLKTVAEVHDFSELLSDPKLFVSAHFDELSKIMRHQLKERDVVGVYGLPFYTQYFPNECTQLTQFLDDEIKAIRSSILVKKEHSKHHATHFLRNLPYIASFPTIENLVDFAKDIPTVLVGAGPSLSKTIPFLQQFQKNLFIICVDVAVKSLIKHQIHPHLICTLEQNDISWRTLQNLDLENSFLAIGESANPNNFSMRTKGKFIILQENHDFIPEFAKAIHQQTIESCATVTSAAFQIAKLSGGNPIILCGQDLGFTGNEVYHKDTSFRETEVMEQKVAELSRKNPLTLTYKERLLLDPIHGSFLTEEDRFLSVKIFEHCKEKNAPIPFIIENLDQDFSPYQEFLFACNEYHVNYRNILFNSAEVHYHNSVHSKQRLQQPTVRILDVNGKWIATNISYKTTAIWLGKQAKILKEAEPHRKLYNISDGAMIENFQVVTVEQAGTIISKTFSEIMSQLEYACKSISDDRVKIRHWMNNKKKDIQKIVSLSAQGVQVTQKLVQLWQKNSSEKSHLIESFNRIHGELNTIFNNGMIWNYYFSAEIQQFDQEKEDVSIQSKEIFFVYQRLYDSIRKEMKTIEAEFEKILIP